VRNNVLINGASAGFASTDHQGKTLNLQVIHNTIINAAHAFKGGSWNDREGMILANNVLYSRDANALNFPNGNAGVISAGNVVFGDGPKDGCVKGLGLGDFPGVTLEGAQHDATPGSDAPIEHADSKYLLLTDLHGKSRSGNVSGAIAP
jgi:hypothetical protein